jgi:mono/diheme cytochrome c family protein
VQAKIMAGGGGMPAFKGRLTSLEIASISAYVAKVAGQGAKKPPRSPKQP